MCSGEGVKVGVHAETKNVDTGFGVKAFYSLHAGDVEAGEGMNTGVVMTPANHDGAVKYYMSTGCYVWAGSDMTPAVLAMAGDGVHMVVGLATIEDALFGVTVAGCVC